MPMPKVGHIRSADEIYSYIPPQQQISVDLQAKLCFTWNIRLCVNHMFHVEHGAEQREHGRSPP